MMKCSFIIISLSTEPVADPQVIYNENENNKYTKQRITISVSAGGRY